MSTSNAILNSQFPLLNKENNLCHLLVAHNTYRRKQNVLPKLHTWRMGKAWDNFVKNSLPRRMSSELKLHQQEAYLPAKEHAGSIFLPQSQPRNFLETEAGFQLHCYFLLFIFSVILDFTLSLPYLVLVLQQWLVYLLVPALFLFPCWVGVKTN